MNLGTNDMRAAGLFAEARRVPPKDQAGFISAGLTRLLADSPISFWSNKRSIPRVARWIVAGIAPYSLPDLEILDNIREALEQSPARQGRIYIFNVLTLATMEDFEKYIPGIGNVYQTPVVGLWEDGVLTQKASGAKARQLLLKFVEG